MFKVCPSCTFDKCWEKAPKCEKCGYDFKLQRKPQIAVIIDEDDDVVRLPPPVTDKYKRCPECGHPCWHAAHVCLNEDCGVVFKGRPAEKGQKSNEASAKKRKGHTNENHFAWLVGGETIEGQSKPDVVKKNTLYTFKGRAKKWQICLYRHNTASNFGEAGKYLADCINAFPGKAGEGSLGRKEYTEHKDKYKAILSPRMVALKDHLSNRSDLSHFIRKAFFDNRVHYLAIGIGDGIYHIFDADDVTRKFSDELEVGNSGGSHGHQKVVFKYGTIVGEIEMRKDNKHYKEIKFWMEARKTLSLLATIGQAKEITLKGTQCCLYGKAVELEKVFN